VLFVGYSFGDSDFQRIYRFMQNQMPEVLPRSYIVTIDDTVDHGLADAHVIRTDAAHFVACLKEELIPRGCLLPDERFAGILPALFAIQDSHHDLYDSIDFDRFPAAILCGHYQDGLLHSFERMIKQRRTGEYSHICDVEEMFRYYEDLRRRKVRSKRYHDAAYIEGYQNGLLYLISDDESRRSLPRYFVYGSKAEIRSIAALKRELRRAPVLHKQAYAQAQRLASEWSSGIVLHHRPEL